MASAVPVSAVPLVFAAPLPEKAPTVKEAVEEYFSDIPILVSVARCESRFRHFNDDGTLHRGEVNEFDVGVMQVNEHYHLESAQKLKLNLHTLEGNLAYARYLYEREGTQPWSSSKKCWKSDAEKLAQN